MQEILYVKINNQRELSRVIQNVEKVNFQRISAILPTWEQVKKSFHGNSKVIMKLYPNRILNRAEWQLTTLSTEKRNDLKIGKKNKYKDVTDHYMK